MKNWLKRTVVILGVIGGLIGGISVDLRAQGPYSAQIQAALRTFIATAHTWTGTQTFTNVTVNGTCTGCGSGGAPAASKYIVQGTVDATLTQAQFLGALNTGLLINTTTSGVLSAYGGSTCTNQAVTAIGVSGAATCTTLTSAYVNNTIALTGTDINTSNQVTATHLASALPSVQGGTGLTAGLVAECDVRLTLTSGLPVTTADVTGAANVFVTPYKGNVCWFYDGSTNWTARAFSEITVALGTLTSGLPYDIFCYDNSGTMACDSPLAWTNTTTRATALVLQNGVYVKSGATTRRYMGSFYTTATTTTEDSVLKRFLYNYYNPQPAPLVSFDATNSWNYTTATVRQAHGLSTNKVEILVGVADKPLLINLTLAVTNSNATGVNVVAGIGIDTTTVFTVSQGTAIGGTFYAPIAVVYSGVLAAGYHYASWNEFSAATSTTTWIEPSAFGSGPTNNGGLSGTWVH